MIATLGLLRERLKSSVVSVLAPLLNWLAERQVMPNQVSWAGLTLGVVAAVWAGVGVFVLAGLFYLLCGVADLVDGALARRMSMSSKSGAFIDSLADRVGEGLLHVGLAVVFARWGMWLAVLAVGLSLTGSYLTSYARARAESLGVGLDEALVTRGERVILLGFGLVFHFAVVALWILVAASWVTTGYRTAIAWRRLSLLDRPSKPHEAPSP